MSGINDDFDTLGWLIGCLCADSTATPQARMRAEEARVLLRKLRAKVVRELQEKPKKKALPAWRAPGLFELGQQPGDQK